MRIPLDSTMKYSLTFRSSDTTVLRLPFELTVKAVDDGYEDDGYEVQAEFAEICHEVFSQASRTIWDFTLLTNVNCLRMHHSYPIINYLHIAGIMNEVGQLFMSVGSLEELILYHCDVQPYLVPLLDDQILSSVENQLYSPQSSQGCPLNM